MTARARPVQSPMNKTEAAYAARLELLRRAGEIRSWRYEPVRFVLGKACSYLPDFMVVLNDGTVEFVETKSMWRSKGRKRAGWKEDSRVKWKVAARMFPEFRFRAAVKDGASWVMEDAECNAP